MSVPELERQVQGLPPDDLARFIQWFDGYRRQILGDILELDEWEGELSEEQKAELLRRVEFAKAHPEALEQWEGTTDRIRRQLHALHDQKTSTGGN